METGRVKWFNDQKGFGFITPDAGGDDVFVHHSVIDGQGFRKLLEGEKVQYESQVGAKGAPLATRVLRMTSTSPGPPKTAD